MGDRGKGKRPRLDDEGDDDRRPMEKRVRFPKGKKAKKGDEACRADEGGFSVMVDPRMAAKERARRRNQIREENLFGDENTDPAAAEVDYDENTKFEDDGIKIEPFNMKQEEEEGYFDENGNYVEYIGNEIKDAWLDSAVVDTAYADKDQKNKPAEDDDHQELSSEDIGKLKRSIANMLEPGETIIQALKRLKGTASDKKGRMSEGTKRMFDQLTEDAMKLLENGEYNVYHEERETFEREADGYERIALARQGIFASAEDHSLGTNRGVISSNVSSYGVESTSMSDRHLHESQGSASLPVSTTDADEFDMFGDDEDNSNLNPQPDGNGLASVSSSEQFPQSAPESSNHYQDLNSGEAATGTESDYVYDQSSGYYYSSSLGYYYDPASTLYCSATSGKWYSFDEQTGEYAECQNNETISAEESEGVGPDTNTELTGNGYV